MKGFGLPRGIYTLNSQKELAASILVADEHYSDIVTETAGFVPLEVRFQKLIENGIKLQLNAKEFDSVDMRKLYLDDEFRVEPDDELEDIQVKLDKRAAFLADFKAKHSEALKKAESSEAEFKTSGSNSESKEPEVGKRSASDTD